MSPSDRTRRRRWLEARDAELRAAGHKAAAGRSRILADEARAARQRYDSAATRRRIEQFRFYRYRLDSEDAAIVAALLDLPPSRGRKLPSLANVATATGLPLAVVLSRWPLLKCGLPAPLPGEDVKPASKALLRMIRDSRSKRRETYDTPAWRDVWARAETLSGKPIPDLEDVARLAATASKRCAGCGGPIFEPKPRQRHCLKSDKCRQRSASRSKPATS